MIGLNEVSKRIVDIVLESNYLNRENLIEQINVILRIWVKKTTKHINYESFLSDKKEAVLRKTSEHRDFERNYWKNIVKNKSTSQEMQTYFAELDKIREDSTFSESSFFSTEP